MSVQLQEKVVNAPKKWTLSYPRRPSCTAVPKIDPRRPRRPPDGLIPGPPGHSRPPHTPWGHCGRLGWPVVTCGGHPQPSRRSRTPFRYGCPRVCGSPAGDSGDLCRHHVNLCNSTTTCMLAVRLLRALNPIPAVYPPEPPGLRRHCSLYMYMYHHQLITTVPLLLLFAVIHVGGIFQRFSSCTHSVFCIHKTRLSKETK